MRRGYPVRVWRDRLGASTRIARPHSEGSKIMTTTTSRTGLDALLTPKDSLLMLIDDQPQMAFAVGSHDRQTMLNNVVGLAKSAKAYEVPTILTTIGAKGFAGPLFPEVQAVFPEQPPIDRTTM